MADQFAKDTLVDHMQGGNNYFLGLVAGIIAAVIGAGAWMGITLATESHLGLVAIGVGALVGYAVRIGGRGRTIIFGIMGAVLTALSCLAGEVATVIQLASSPEHNFFDSLQHTDLMALISTILEKTDPISWLIYAFGIFEGFKFSIRK
jgi:hypothetical protein